MAHVLEPRRRALPDPRDHLTGRCFRWFNDVFSDWTEFCPELHDYYELEDSLLVTGRIRACGRTSGVELNSAIWWRYKFRDGRILRLDASREPTDEHRAAGLADIA
jgi:ketosteroid isomerase-like protein